MIYLNLITHFKADGRHVKFQHIYSHIEHKRWATKARNEAAKLHTKLQVLKDKLWGPFEPWIKGNEGVDRLASKGHSKPHVLGTWTVPPLSTEVTIFDPKGMWWRATYAARPSGCTPKSGPNANQCKGRSSETNTLIEIPHIPH
jgi:hypothetical protein